MPWKPKDIIGQKFHRLTVMSRAPNKSGDLYYNCVCDCGNNTITASRHMKSGRSKSCGCLRAESTIKTKTTHGLSHSVEHKILVGMVTRCTNKAVKSFQNYGARGISVCQRWYSDGIYHTKHFVSDMGERPTKKHSIERVNNDKNYSPDNCEWVTHTIQSNNRRSNRLIEHDGRILTLAQWAKERGMKTPTLHARLKSGWSIHDSLTIKVGSVWRK